MLKKMIIPVFILIVISGYGKDKEENSCHVVSPNAQNNIVFGLQNIPA
jgi:hypothetical protein